MISSKAPIAPRCQVAARGGSLKEAWDAARAECDPKFADYAIYEHCLPFNVARAYDEARGIDTPPASGPLSAIWTCGKRCKADTTHARRILRRHAASGHTYRCKRNEIYSLS